MKATVIYNPWAGRRPARALVDKAVEHWRSLGWEVDVQRTRRPGDARRLAQIARDNRMDRVFVAGGDGSLSQAADALAGAETVLGVLPVGTANLWAQEIGLMRMGEPTPPIEHAAAALASAPIREIDLGQMGDQHFMLWLGMGLDGHIVQRVEKRSRLEKMLGIPYYTLVGVLAAVQWRGRAQAVTVDGKDMGGQLLLTLIGNSRLYGGGLFRLSPDARMDDGLLELWVLEGKSFVDGLSAAWDLFKGRNTLKGVRHATGKEIVISADRRLPVQVDGEYIGRRRNLTITVRPRALRVVVPDSAPDDLFQAGAKTQQA